MIHHLIRMDKFINGDSVGLGKTLDVVAATAWLKERNPDAKVVIVTTKSTAQPLDAGILTPMGWVKMGSTRVGDTLVDPDGGTSLVLGIHPQGAKDVYRVTTTDGESTECCLDHLWEVQTLHLKRSGRFKTVSLKDIVKHGVTYKYGNTTGYSYRLPITAPVEFSGSIDPFIPAYTLGVLLGDGSLRHGAIFYAEEKEIVTRVSSEVPHGYRISERASGQYAIVQSSCGGTNGVMDYLRQLGVFGNKSPNKYVPEIYLTSSIKSRIELLSGLMDTDGSCSESGECTFKTSSTELRDGVVSLVRSLGGIASIQPTPQKPKSSSTLVRGVVRTITPKYAGWTVTVQTPFNPFYLSRKAENWHQPKLCRSIKSVELVGRRQVQCISTSAKRGLYITDGYIVTHNTYQWRDEFLRFSHLRPFVMKDKYQGLTSSEARQAQMEKFLNGKRKDVIIVKYDSIKGTRKKTTEKFEADGTPIKGGKEMDSGDVKFFTKIFKEHKENLILVFDECHRFKGTQTAVRNLVFSIARSAGKVWGLTATVMKNSLNEFYAVATALGICPFGFMPDFVEEFCIMRPQYIGGGRKKMVLVGYQNISKFKAGIRPFFLGRSQRQVKEPLPQLTTVYHPLDLTDQQIDLLDDIKTGAFILPPALIKDKDGDLHEQERDPDNLMTQLSVQQLVANHPALLDPADLKTFYTTKLSPKEEALLDMLDGDLSGEKVIVFTKYKMWIDRMEKITKSGDFTNRKFLRITGNENEKQRNDNKRLFQGSADHDLIVINAAGIEGINLQQAAHMVLLDVPWSWGDLIQLVGRMVRMASPHSACTLHVLVAKGTIDEYAIETLKGKKGVFEKILGESHSAGILDDQNLVLDLESGMEAGNSDDEYRALLKAHVKTIGLSVFLVGDQITKARNNKEYKMVFEDKGKKSRKKHEIREDRKWGTVEEL